MNDRPITRYVAGVLLLLCVISARAAAADRPAPDAPILGVPLTHSDWVLKDNVPGLDDGLAGVRHVLDMCKAAGWSRIYWRCLDSGRSLHPCQLMDPMGAPHGDNGFDFDPKPELQRVMSQHAATSGRREAIIWSTGQRDAEGPPVGKLLSDNVGYWGEVVLTGVTYTYESGPDNPPDRFQGDASLFGRRLLDGRVGGNWWVPVGQGPGQPLKAVFDFKRPCCFTEVDAICTRTPNISLKIDVRQTENDPWVTVLDRPLDQAPGTPVNRARLAGNPAGRFMRVSVGSAETTWLDEILVWGTAEVSQRYPENIAPTYRRDLAPGTLCSVPGMAATVFPQDRFSQWQSSLGQHATAPAVWAEAEQASPAEPILPDAEAINPHVHLFLARNETESRFLTLTNVSATDPLALTIDDIRLCAAGSEEPDARVQARLLVGGALPAAAPQHPLTDEQRLRLMIDGDMPTDLPGEGDVAVLPFFDRGQLLGRSLMERYLANGLEIRDYPRVVLPPGGSAVFMLRATTSGLPPGRYTGSICAVTDSGVRVATPLEVDVVDVTLPDLDLWIHSWGNSTSQFPFETQSRFAHDVRANRELGVTVFSGWPEPGSKASLFGSAGRTYYHVMGIPDSYVHRGYGGQLDPGQLTAEDESRLAAHLQELVARAQQLGLQYDDWWVELWDEPQENNVAIFAALARILRRTDSHVRIFMNPLFWRPGHAPDEVIVQHLAPWYNELIDVSVPITTLVGDNLATRELWAKPRFVRAFYIHPAARGGRAMAWKAFDLGFNGWGYYCYFSPRGNPWDIRTWTELGYSYQMVFPGPAGPIIMPIYEEMRDGWEDYRLLAVLREHGRDEALQDLIRRYRSGEPLPELRRAALRSCARPHMTQ
ncbi:MAG: DUF4091 domain-containing protein [Planctomycetaceae bacterium]|nr:DUF4091 domain-containing protein [Planctomycetaceae bacterium]